MRIKLLALSVGRELRGNYLVRRVGGVIPIQQWWVSLVLHPPYICNSIGILQRANFLNLLA